MFTECPKIEPDNLGTEDWNTLFSNKGWPHGATLTYSIADELLQESNIASYLEEAARAWEKVCDFTVKFLPFTGENPEEANIHIKFDSNEMHQWVTEVGSTMTTHGQTQYVAYDSSGYLKKVEILMTNFWLEEQKSLALNIRKLEEITENIGELEEMAKSATIYLPQHGTKELSFEKENFIGMITKNKLNLEAAKSQLLQMQKNSLRTIIHEFGHAIGFGHPDNSENLSKQINNISKGLKCTVMIGSEELFTNPENFCTGEENCDSLKYAVYPGDWDKQMCAMLDSPALKKYLDSKQIIKEISKHYQWLIGNIEQLSADEFQEAVQKLSELCQNPELPHEFENMCSNDSLHELSILRAKPILEEFQFIIDRIKELAPNERQEAVQKLSDLCKNPELPHEFDGLCEEPLTKFDKQETLSTLLLFAGLKMMTGFTKEGLDSFSPFSKDTNHLIGDALSLLTLYLMDTEDAVLPTIHLIKMTVTCGLLAAELLPKKHIYYFSDLASTVISAYSFARIAPMLVSSPMALGSGYVMSQASELSGKMFFKGAKFAGENIYSFGKGLGNRLGFFGHANNENAYDDSEPQLAIKHKI